MKNHTTAKLIAKSVSSNTGQELVTLELEYPRFIHDQLLTHRLLSRSSSSSRAIPTARMMDHIKNVPGCPIYWGLNKAGMSAKEELSETDKTRAIAVWQAAADANIVFAEELNKLHVHKQIANRPVDTWSTMKVIVSATEWANFYHLRKHEDAQPEFRELANKMFEAATEANAQVLQPGQWHLPYIDISVKDNVATYKDTLGNELSLEDAKIVSASCCAQVSYRTTDDTLEKAKKVFDKLVKSDIVHGSSIEHIATPMLGDGVDQNGITHMTRNGDFWSGNFRHWIQFRKTIQEEAKW